MPDRRGACTHDRSRAPAQTHDLLAHSSKTGSEKHGACKYMKSHHARYVRTIKDDKEEDGDEEVLQGVGGELCAGARDALEDVKEVEALQECRQGIHCALLCRRCGRGLMRQSLCTCEMVQTACSYARAIVAYMCPGGCIHTHSHGTDHHRKFRRHVEYEALEELLNAEPAQEERVVSSRLYSFRAGCIDLCVCAGVGVRIRKDANPGVARHDRHRLTGSSGGTHGRRRA